MNIIWLVGILIVTAVFVVVVTKVSRRRHGLNSAYFQKRWQQVVELVKEKNGMQLSLIEADKILEEALKKCHFGGKTTGERLVSAQKALTNNDAVWHAHKLRNRIVHEANVAIKSREVEEALRGFRQALKDLGALK